MTRRAARAVTGARRAPRPRAGSPGDVSRGPDRRSGGPGDEGPVCREATDPEATEARWRLTPKGEAFIASLRAAAAAGKDRR
jgi:hypothetical protein